ncbi:MAG: hypothetical protein AABX79_03210 [Nanoarchaeota archaeon]
MEKSQRYHEAWKRLSRASIDFFHSKKFPPKKHEKVMKKLYEKEREIYKKAFDEAFDERDKTRRKWAEEHRASIENLLESIRKKAEEGIDKIVVNIRGSADSYEEWTETEMTYEVYNPKEKDSNKYLAGLEITETYHEPVDI